eukprot:303667-Pelagomonas_calceolata.AAC.1
MESCWYVTSASRSACPCASLRGEKTGANSRRLDDGIDLDNLVNQGFEGNPQSLSESPWLSSTEAFFPL